jgi:hypothetical protein
MSEQKVLLVVTGSNNKLEGGSPPYDPAGSLAQLLPRPEAGRLFKCRRRVWNLMRGGKPERGGKKLRQLPWNKGLVCGPDLGGDDRSGHYLPAAERFAGRFYEALGPEGPALLTEHPRHEVLILTPLYGLVRPTERIQLFSCDIDDADEIGKAWMQDQLLTQVLCAFIQHQRITCVLDLTAEERYRQLIEWERVRGAAGQVLHCFGRQTAGDALLLALGHMARTLLSEWSAERVQRLQEGQELDGRTDRIVVSTTAAPPSNAPHELDRRRLTRKDELYRMHDAILEVLRHLRGRNVDPNRENVPQVIREVGLPLVVEQSMISIVRVRNKAKGEDYTPDDVEWMGLQSDYAAVKQWASDHGIELRKEWRDV